MFLKKIEDFRIILASKSPRRQFLLKELGLDFEIIDDLEVAENYPDILQPTEIPVYLSKIKAEAYINKLRENDILITADTIVWMDNMIFNKPFDKIEAFYMLNKLSGNSHKVITGVSITSIKKQLSFFSETEVHFAKLANEEINYYIDNFKPFDKAGAYGIQEWIGYIAIDKIVGSYYNVMGLPIQRLYSNLKLFIEKQ